MPEISRFLIAEVAAFLLMAVSFDSLAQNNSPVRIVFDKNSKRIDMVTGKQLLNYTQAQRGSFEFFEGRLDLPVKKINYMFATMVSANFDNVALIRKMHTHNIWALVTMSGKSLEGMNPIMTADVVKIYAASFIPINPATGQPESRIHVLLDDMYLIQWVDVDHWLANKSQEEYESEQGVRY
ncbi:MAG: hypothetical protein Q8O92_05695 [Candidatus Latescibacter sp.]|nr:hypothetical protein [Candidatus Latescibacter sp.]